MMNNKPPKSPIKTVELVSKLPSEKARARDNPASTNITTSAKPIKPKINRQTNNEFPLNCIHTMVLIFQLYHEQRYRET